MMILPKNKVLRISLRLCRALATKVTSPNQNYVKMHLQHQDQRSSLIHFPGNLLGPRVLHPSGKELRHHCRPTTQVQLHPPKAAQSFPERLELPFPIDAVTLRRYCLLGHRPVHRVGKDRPWCYLGTTCGRCSKKATADFREASERRHDTSSQAYRFNKILSCRSPVQERLSICNWNPGPRRGKKMPSRSKSQAGGTSSRYKKQSEYVDHDILTYRFHVTHYGGCPILFNKDTFHPNIDVKSIYLHDIRRDFPDQVMEGEQGWVMQGVLSRASFRRSPVSGQKSFTVLSQHVSNMYAKKKGIAKKLILTLRTIMISQGVDSVAGDFNGTAWRCRSRNNLSTIDEAFADCALPTPPGRPPLRGPGSIPDIVGIRLRISHITGFSTPFGK